MAKYVLALDQAQPVHERLFDHNGAIVSAAQREFPQFILPRLVKNPEDIWSTPDAVVRKH